MAAQWSPPAGWYPDPRDPRWLRFWDGTAWTAHTQPHVPTAPQPAPMPARSPASRSGARVWWQTWWAIVPALVLCLPVGLVGLWLRRDTSAGVKAVTSVATTILFVVVVATGASSEDGPTAEQAPAASDTPSATAAPSVVKAEVPALKGLNQSRALRMLRAAGLEIGQITRKQTSARPGTVLSQGVPTGTSVEAGTEIALVIAVPFPKIPSVVGRVSAAAESQLRRAGYVVKRVYRTRTSGRDGEIIGQSPRSGVPARKGSVVTLTVLRVVAPPPQPPAPQPANCTPGYSPCLTPAPDYDCAGGSGNGPAYTGPVRVTGSDPYDLDADGDGYACEW